MGRPPDGGAEITRSLPWPLVSGSVAGVEIIGKIGKVDDVLSKQELMRSHLKELQMAD